MDGGPIDAMKDGNIDAPGDGGPGDGAPVDAPPGFDGPAGRGQYLARVLNCGGCHTPQVNGAADPTKTLAGIDCRISAVAGFDAGTDAGVCLSSANLTNDVTGIKNLTDQQVIDAMRTGVHQSSTDAGAKYLFDNMPYYQYTHLKDEDAQAIVAYLRAVPPVSHMVKDSTPPFDQRPTAPQTVAPDLAKIPAAGPDAGAGAENGRYLSIAACINCHTVPATVAAGEPKHIDETKAWQGGRASTGVVMGVTKMYQSPNLTPDATGIMGWTNMDLVTAMKMAKDRMGRMLCPPMRAFPLSDSDAADIASYLLSLPPVMNMRTMTCM